MSDNRLMACSRLRLAADIKCLILSVQWAAREDEQSRAEGHLNTWGGWWLDRDDVHNDRGRGGEMRCADTIPDGADGAGRLRCGQFAQHAAPPGRGKERHATTGVETNA